MSDSDLFISVSVISMSEYEIVISTEFDIIINRYCKFLICLVRVLLLFSPYISFLQHLFFVTHRVVFCRDHPVRYFIASARPASAAIFSHPFCAVSDI